MDLNDSSRSPPPAGLATLCRTAARPPRTNSKVATPASAANVATPARIHFFLIFLPPPRYVYGVCLERLANNQKTDEPGVRLSATGRSSFPYSPILSCRRIWRPFPASLEEYLLTTIGIVPSRQHGLDVPDVIQRIGRRTRRNGQD